MLMKRTEWDNAVKLLRLQWKAAWLYYIIMYVAVMGWMTFFTISIDINSMSDDDSFNILSAPDLSYTSIVMAIALPVMIAIMRREMEKPLDVFPHTGASRFVAWQMYCGLFTVILGLLTLASNIATCAVYGHIAESKNVAILNPFDLGDQLLGLLSWLLFVLVVSALASLLAALMEKYRIRALIPLTAFAGLIIAYTFLLAVYTRDFSNIGETLSPAYLLLWAAVWILLTFAAFLVMRGTPRDDAPVTGGNMAIRIWKAGVLSVLVLQSGVFIGEVFPNNVAQTVYDTVSVHEPENAPVDETLILDAADIPAGKVTSLSMEGIRNFEEGDPEIDDAEREFDFDGLGLTLNYSEDELANFGGKQIVINVRYARQIIGKYDLTEIRNQRFDAWIEGTVLHLKYSYDTPWGIVALPEWNFLDWGIGLYYQETNFGTVDIDVGDLTDSRYEPDGLASSRRAPL
ncbi:MAG: hypothetical protein LBL54_02935 [Clostridiales Family XIII bacterium]|jgi:hypothetical protein|nr:hypothetical protein [Clostridiales Family XIII bacterium]